MIEMYLVGGAVRDLQLGVKPKDYDFTVVADSYDDMKDFLMRRKSAEIFLEKPEFGTVRAAVSGFVLQGYDPSFGSMVVKKQRVAADFVLARKDGTYSDGRRPDEVEVGSLYDDLARRDFTVNAMALSAAGVLIDPFRGQRDLQDMELRTVGKRGADRLIEDALRAIRALRFVVTKGFTLHPDLRAALTHAQVLYNLEYLISKERVREELYKMFRHDTLLTIKTLEQFPLIRAIVLGPNTPVWLKPTTEE